MLVQMNIISQFRLKAACFDLKAALKFAKSCEILNSPVISTIAVLCSRSLKTKWFRFKFTRINVRKNFQNKNKRTVRIQHGNRCSTLHIFMTVLALVFFVNHARKTLSLNDYFIVDKIVRTYAKRRDLKLNDYFFFNP